MTEEAEAQLCRLSASTIDRILRRWRGRGLRHSLSTTKPGTLLKNAIPIRTFSEWEDTRPGFIEADLVAHCGDSAEGFYLTTLSTVDVATGWCEPVAVWGKGQDRVGGAVYDVRKRLPMPLLGLDSDNGSEFINQSLYVYTLLRLYVNFFQPVLKLVGKSRHGAKVHKVYDTAQTPYQRLLKSGILTDDKKRELANIYGALNPVTLLKQIRQDVEHLWTLAERQPSLSSSAKTRSLR